MSVILHIDTSLDKASVCLSKEQEVIFFYSNEKKNDHATWLHTAIRNGLHSSGYNLHQSDAIAVTIGPGSYTGLRIGLASAKGLCYTLHKPLIGLNTLLVMTHVIKTNAEELICPMIDARRMEVFTAIYNKDLEEIIKPSAMVLDENSFTDELKEYRILFCGNGAEKFKKICNSENASFSDNGFDARDMISPAIHKYINKDFLDLAYSEPIYLKEFFTPGK